MLAGVLITVLTAICLKHARGHGASSGRQSRGEVAELRLELDVAQAKSDAPGHVIAAPADGERSSEAPAQQLATAVDVA